MSTSAREHRRALSALKCLERTGAVWSWFRFGAVWSCSGLERYGTGVPGVHWSAGSAHGGIRSIEAITKLTDSESETINHKK